MMKKLAGMLLVVVVSVLWCGVVLGEEPKKPAEDPMMQAWMKAMTPGPEHAQLAKAAGKWKLKTTSWMDPSQPPSVTEGTSERKMVLGGRYLEDITLGSFSGMEYEGRGWTGFDNVDHKYYGTWIDNFGTGVMTLVGTCDEAKKVCTFVGQLNDPMTQKPAKMRMVETWTDDDHSVTEFYGPGPDGKEYMSMKIEAVRIK